MAKKDDSVDNHVSGQSNEPMSRPAHALTFNQVVEELKTDTLSGLTEAEAKQRHEKFGNNDLGEADGVQPLKIIIAQVANAMTLVSSKPVQFPPLSPHTLENLCFKHISMAELFFFASRLHIT
jgi:magnesium-transporting ATPase (P-type)